MSDGEAPGPIDFLLLEFPDAVETGPVAAQLENLLSQGTVLLYDIAAVRRPSDGAAVRIDLDEGAPTLDGFAAFAGAQSGLFDESDIQEAGEVLDPGTSAVLLAYENAWARGFVTAAHAAGGRVAASDRIPAQVLLDALDAAEAQKD